MLKLLHRVLYAPTTARTKPKKERFPLGAYVREKHRQQKEIIDEKLQLSDELSLKKQEVIQRKEELNLLKKSVHALEEKIRRKRKKVCIVKRVLL